MKKKPSKSNKKGTLIAIACGVIIIGIVIALSYFMDQAKISGQRFGNNLEQIQTDLKKEASDYESKLIQWEEGDLTKQEILQISKNHITKLESLLSRYDTLLPPQSFAPSLELFRQSTQAQLESDRLLKEWIETGDNSAKVRSNELLQQSFEYETNALASFSAAKRNNTP